MVSKFIYIIMFYLTLTAKIKARVKDTSHNLKRGGRKCTTEGEVEDIVHNLKER
jgi:hypothetical protein